MSWVGCGWGEGGNPLGLPGVLDSKSVSGPGGTVDRNLLTNAWDMGSILLWEDSTRHGQLARAPQLLNPGAATAGSRA